MTNSRVMVLVKRVADTSTLEAANLMVNTALFNKAVIDNLYINFDKLKTTHMEQVIENQQLHRRIEILGAVVSLVAQVPSIQALELEDKDSMMAEIKDLKDNLEREVPSNKSLSSEIITSLVGDRLWIISLRIGDVYKVYCDLVNAKLRYEQDMEILGPVRKQCSLGPNS